MGSEGNTIFGIGNWEIYRRAAELVKEISQVQGELLDSRPTWIPKAKLDLNVLKMLRNGNVAEFNDFRKKGNILSVNLIGVDLHGVDLRKIDLHDAQLAASNLSSANLSQANLAKADLREAILDRANLELTNLTGAVLNYASLKGTILTNAKMNGVRMVATDMTDTNLEGADLSYTTINTWNDIDFTGANMKGTRFGKFYLDEDYLLDFKKRGAIIQD